MLNMILALAVLVAALAGWAAWNGTLFTKSGNETIYLTEAVKRGPMDISIVERGSLESANNMVISCKVEGEAGTSILKIVDEGTRVREGDVIVELDSSRLRDLGIQQKIVVEQAAALMDQAEKNVAIQETQNESDIAAAKLKLELAELDLEKYKEGDYEQEQKTIAGEIKLAQEDRTRAAEQLQFTERLIKKGYATQSQLEADKLAVTKAEITLAVALEKERLLTTYTKKRMLAELNANALEFARELERVKLKAQAALAQYKADFSARKLTYSVEKEKLDKYQAQIELCTITAPRDGMVVYANSRSSSRGSNEPLIYEGAKVKERQAIINLPDITQMQVSARIHESKIDQVTEGLPASVRVDARPGETFRGKVDMVSLVPVSGNWPNFNLKEYVTTIKITEDASKTMSLKPGLTAEVEIQVAHLPEALQVPIQSVVERGSRYFSWVFDGTKVNRHELKVGKSNETVMEIRDGLQEGQRVILNPRTILPKEIAQLEEEIPALSPTAPAVPGPMPEAAPEGGAKRPGSEGGKKAGASPGGGGRAFDPLAMFQQADKDGDGKLSAEEIGAMSERARGWISSADKNGDKFVDLEEFQQARPARPAGGAPGGGPKAAGDGAAPRSEAGGG
jgi:HlyD family secretion protein